jgi:hypothetical protein
MSCNALPAAWLCVALSAVALCISGVLSNIPRGGPSKQNPLTSAYIWLTPEKQLTAHHFFCAFCSCVFERFSARGVQKHPTNIPQNDHSENFLQNK